MEIEASASKLDEREMVFDETRLEVHVPTAGLRIRSPEPREPAPENDEPVEEKTPRVQVDDCSQELVVFSQIGKEPTRAGNSGTLAGSSRTGRWKFRNRSWLRTNVPGARATAGRARRITLGCRGNVGGIATAAGGWRRITDGNAAACYGSARPAVELKLARFRGAASVAHAGNTAWVASVSGWRAFTAGLRGWRSPAWAPIAFSSSGTRGRSPPSLPLLSLPRATRLQRPLALGSSSGAPRAR